MSDTPTTSQELLRAWAERAETLRASGRLEAAEERERACAELSAFYEALTATLTAPLAISDAAVEAARAAARTTNDAAEVRPLGPWPNVRPLELPTHGTPAVTLPKEGTT